MKRKNVTIALAAFLMFTGASKLNAQETESTESTESTELKEKKSFKSWLTETPWTVGFGGSIIQDGGELIKKVTEYTFYPATFTADKDLSIKGWSAQFAFSSTSLNPHGFLSGDINFKYDFNNLIGDTKWFDPYSTLGVGVTYRDQTVFNPSYDKNTKPTFNAGLGANLWLNKIMAINLQGQAKLTKDPYLQANIGLVFKLNSSPAECETMPKTPETEDALNHLRGIINK